MGDAVHICLNDSSHFDSLWGLNGTLGYTLLPAPDALGVLMLMQGPMVDMIFRTLTTLLLFPWIPAAGTFVIVFCFRTLPKQLGPSRKKFDKMESSVWTIHGKQYDMTGYVKHHPGGEWAINLGRNRDCTGLFESYHVFADRAKLDKILARYEIRQIHDRPPVDVPSKIDDLVFNDAFHQEVKEMCRKHFQGKSHKMKPSACCVNLMMVFLQIYSIYYFLCGRIWAMIVWPLTGALLSFTLAHDASHFAVSRRPWLNSLASYAGMPTTFPATCWSLQHVVQHHVYVNDHDDVDLFHFLPACRTTRLTRWAKSFRWQYLVIWFLLPTVTGHLTMVVPVDLISGQIDLVTGERRYEQVQNLDDFVARSRLNILGELLTTLTFYVLSIMSFGLVDGIRRMWITHSIASILFVLATQGAHLQEECMVGTEEEYSSWAKRQAASSVNFAVDSRFWSFLSGGLNTQSIHHVVPSIACSHYHDLYPEFRRICAKHGIHLKETSSVIKFFQGFVKWIGELAEVGEESESTTSKRVEERVLRLATETSKQALSFTHCGGNP
eukprot:CAMPEP_0172865036 /NCGR_PEP_ID=MMETSP1075-20121228/81173_1 /TAXON_ID=2916 /ORGANISM="Ceratium fusus, Strain PA161109" /LENGTH=551 /DNA_ID=CAMNT_0013714021 /DNA_START=35 /DNA_END=1688 /DNA_ORIENTATION=+